MHLKKIKLAGFKSFVDPTTIPITNKMTGIVGPNGCGKSNIIDAIRWVMGESSAKNLRGDSMADVIFSGSNSRKPVGKAGVELIFDNTSGKAPGQYASYAEISIRREMARDGQSAYFLNKTRCRRKDIIDIFLGTGLGPRTYSIIEQGMVTRIIESKPEDLRGFLEEAAGISRYKERRRETEMRIRHTRENLDRVNDIRLELEKQLRRLKRQSRAAVRYKDLKQEERQLHAQLLALRWQAQQIRLQEIESVIAGKQTVLDKRVSEQREIEAAIEAIRNEQIETNNGLNAVQKEFYALSGEISNIEQAIQHTRETRTQQMREHEQVNHSWEEATRHLQADLATIEKLAGDLMEREPEMARRSGNRNRAEAVQSDAEQAMQVWQNEWQTFSDASAEPEKVREIQKARIIQLEAHRADLEARLHKLGQEATEINRQLDDDALTPLRDQSQRQDHDCETQAENLESIETRIRNLKLKVEEGQDEYETLRGQQQQLAARLASLEELQAAAQGKDANTLQDWLAQQGLDNHPRLCENITVQPGWEKAVERVLGANLKAVCVDDLEQYRAELNDKPVADLILVDKKANTTGIPKEDGRLDAQVRSDISLAHFLATVHTAESLNDALAMRSQLASGESVITRDGVWLGVNWISFAADDNASTGILRRKQEMQSLTELLAAEDEKITNRLADIARLQRELEGIEDERDEQRRDINESQRERAKLFEQLGHVEAQHEQWQSRKRQIEQEIQDLETQLERNSTEMGQARDLLKAAEGERGEHDQRRQQLQERRQDLIQQLETSRREAAEARDVWHQLDVELQRMRTTVDSTQQSVARLEGQLKHLAQRRDELAQNLSQGDEPEIDLKSRLEEFLNTRIDVEGRLGQAREKAEGMDSGLREEEQARSAQEKRVQQHREEMEADRVKRQEILVRRDTLSEQAQEAGHDLPDVVAELPEEASEAAWHELLEGVERKINRLGAINLVAIEEYEEESERKQYLDKQYEDLSKALEILEEAMRKIDRETRTRFKETFDKVNIGLQTFFPKLFGGGHAYLELTGDDLLTTGVTVMARPPGKRNTTIHLLSGGEKALTAVALLFSIFELNPAPFCLLDEVDAPLDDANVERYSELLESLSDDTQLIYVTHNKISMEKAEVLIGVTMSEPGVSRLVAVDVDEAMEMVATQ